MEIHLIYTDLDGTFLDENYSCGPLLSTLDELKHREIPVIFCSSKTRAEQEVIRKEVGLNDPFIVEDGSAIIIPLGYFGEQKGEPHGSYEVVTLGIGYERIVNEIARLRERYNLKTYCSMSVEEVARATGLSLEKARLAKEREFSETVIEADEEALRALDRSFSVLLGGSFVQVFGRGSDKGRAVGVLTEMYRDSSETITVGIGNSYNDEPMLRAVDIPALVKNPDGSWADMEIDRLYRADGIGPEGWIEVVRRFVT